MKIIEQFTEGKAGPGDLNDDFISVSENFIAVIDGATSRAGHTLKGLPNGQFASRTIAAGLQSLDRNISARDAIDRLSHILLTEAESAASAEKKVFREVWDFPAAALLVYSAARREIWRVADSSFVVDGRGHFTTFPQEKTWCELRRAYLCAEIARGKTETDLRDHDPTWELLTPLISECKVFANYEGPYGYGVINGTRVPDCHVEVYPAAHANEIIFASDGYPEVESSLADTERYLNSVLRDDPLMYKIHPQVKGVKKGHVSFDDRSYIRFRPN